MLDPSSGEGSDIEGASGELFISAMDGINPSEIREADACIVSRESERHQKCLRQVTEMSDGIVEGALTSLWSARSSLHPGKRRAS